MKMGNADIERRKMKEKIHFVHVSRENAFPEIKLLPVGLVAIADYMAKCGFNPEVIHTGLERSTDHRFNLAEYLRKDKCRIALFDLHWHHQAYSVLEEIQAIKKLNKKVITIVGGFTASFFGEEIMRFYHDVDFIIRGDSEKPLAKLLRILRKGTHSFDTVPNLIWRNAGQIVCNKQTYVADRKVMNELKFANFHFVRCYEKYIQQFSVGPGEYDRIPIFYYVPGRGCSVNCSFCGGSHVAQSIVNKRKGAIFIDIESALRDLKRVKRYGFRKINICFDPFPQGKYYIRLFKAMRSENVDVDIDFECFRLPTCEFIDEFHKTFGNNSTITISPESAVESIRKKNKGMNYSNAELIETLRYLDARSIKVYISFTAGLPFEQRKDVFATIAFIRYLRDTFKNVEINAEAVAMEPASPWFMNPEKYGIIHTRQKFLDFYDASRHAGVIGYRKKYFEENDILAIAQLYKAEARCVLKKSFFLKFLSQQPSVVSTLNFKRVHALCRGCFRYGICFKPITAEGNFKS